MTEPADSADQTDQTDQASQTNQWSESDSASFINLAEIFVPGRAEQIAALLQLIPAQIDEPFTIVELASVRPTSGGNSGEVLRLPLYCPRWLRSYARSYGAKVGSFYNRLEIRPFEIGEQAWRADLPFACVRRLFSLRPSPLSAGQTGTFHGYGCPPEPMELYCWPTLSSRQRLGSHSSLPSSTTRSCASRAWHYAAISVATNSSRR